MNELIIKFCIFSENIHYNEITNILGLNYDSYCEKGGKMNDNKVGAINNEFIWVKNSGISKSEENLNLHIKSIIDLLKPISEKLVNLKKLGCNFQISIIYYYYGNNPGLHINSELFNILSELGIEIDFDIYSL